MSTETERDELDEATREWVRMWADATRREQERCDRARDGETP